MTEAAAAAAASSGELDVPTVIPALEIVATMKEDAGEDGNKRPEEHGK